jgi:hypothetical protein
MCGHCRVSEAFGTAALGWVQRLVAQKGGDPLRQQGAASASRPLCREVASPMSLPAPEQPRHDGRRDTIPYVVENWPRTFRFCLIRLVEIAALVAAAGVVELVRHML